MRRLIALLLLLPLPAWAAGPLDGTWKLDIKSFHFDTKPVELSIGGGRFKCVGCEADTVIDVKADGTDQKVAGTPNFDTANVKIVDNNRIKIAYKKSGAVAFELDVEAAADGKTSTTRWTGHPLQGPPVSGSDTWVRVGTAPSGAHAMSGKWRQQKTSQIADAVATTTYRTTGDSVTMTAGTGESYTAKLGGPDVAMKNVRTDMTVSIKKIDASTFEETYKQGGKPFQVNRITADGKTLKVVSTDAQEGKTTYTMERASGASAKAH